MTKKIYIEPICVYWNNNLTSTCSEWFITKNLEEADYIVSIDNIFLTNSNKPKILYLVEPENVLRDVYFNTYENLLNSNADVIITHHKKYVNNKKIKYSPPPFSPWVKNFNLFNKSKICSMITSNKTMCEEHRNRVKIALKNKNNLDLYGIGFNPINLKNEGLNDYYFSVAIENYETNGYYTEKILDCFLTGTIPIYRGDKDIGLEYNSNGIIVYNDDYNFKDLNKELYLSKFEYVKENYQKAMFNIQNKYNSFDNYILSGINHYEFIYNNTN